MATKAATKATAKQAQAAQEAMRAPIEWRGNMYRLEFNLNVMEQIQDAYGSLDAWSDAAMGKKSADGTPDIKAVIFGFGAMINEAVDMDNEDNGTEVPPLTSKQVGRLVSSIGFTELVERMQSEIVKSTATDSKNA